MKLVFLDIDGVLNSRAWVEGLGRDRGLEHLDPAACARVQRLCDESGAKLVISSTWRLIHKRAAICDMFRARDLTTTILGMTAALHTNRGHEIQAWLDASPGIADLGTIDGMVIVDDDADMVHLAPWHVKTDVNRGFTDRELRQATEVLSRPMPGATPHERIATESTQARRQAGARDGSQGVEVRDAGARESLPLAESDFLRDTSLRRGDLDDEHARQIREGGRASEQKATVR